MSIIYQCNRLIFITECLFSTHWLQLNVSVCIMAGLYKWARAVWTVNIDFTPYSLIELVAALKWNRCLNPITVGKFLQYPPPVFQFQHRMQRIITINLAEINWSPRWFHITHTERLCVSQVRTQMTPVAYRKWPKSFFLWKGGCKVEC